MSRTTNPAYGLFSWDSFREKIIEPGFCGFLTMGESRGLRLSSVAANFADEFIKILASRATFAAVAKRFQGDTIDAVGHSPVNSVLVRLWHRRQFRYLDGRQNFVRSRKRSHFVPFSVASLIGTKKRHQSATEKLFPVSPSLIGTAVVREDYFCPFILIRSLSLLRV